MTLVIAHVSDVHIDLVGQHTPEGVRSVRRTRAVMDYLDQLPYDLDAVLVTGDIADHGEPAEYASAREVLTSRHPTLICPGNHDERAAFRSHLLQSTVDGSSQVAPINQVLRLEHCVIAACDSSVPGKGEGYLDAETLDWLESVLDHTEPDVPVLVAFHHPPERLHIPFIDEIRQFGAERLAAIGRQYPNIAGYLCGHAHTAAATVFADRPLLVAPGVVSTLRLPWEKRADAQDHVDRDLPPALAFHVLEDDGRLTTHFRTVML
ncbi:metallophosphoesterase [Actinospica durhamensis]|uniref:Metallophosphoesterase n=1 Tax=Actinospica durhamensis TaxID=1508375 RepID=A0A941ETE8_9ACTN|nr:metallophosphoesterase [Actinospica durhamensis]MBR7837265.1 metallophosphoesterase [Actinospica durhamensis]